jgi:L-cystine uptake protein TcyP (sodium:dicarboxylate symporter family)
MSLIYQNKFIICLLLALVLSYVFYVLEKDEEKKNNLSAHMLKGVGISVVIFFILYATDENENEVFENIEVGEAPF